VFVTASVLALGSSGHPFPACVLVAAVGLIVFIHWSVSEVSMTRRMVFLFLGMTSVLGFQLVRLRAQSAAPPPAAQTAAVTSVKLQVSIDESGPCQLSLSGTIATNGSGTVWYRFEGPAGVTFDYGPEGTADLGSSEWVGVGKGAKFTRDVRGQFRLEAAMQGPDGKHGPVTVSNVVPEDFKCAGGASAGSQTTTPANQPATAGTANARVTAVRLEVVPAEYSGPCPAKVQLVGTITTDGPGTAYYQFQAGAVGGNREGTVNFSAAGTETVTSEGQVRRTPQVRTVRFLAGMEPRGHQENAKWTDAHLDINCGGGIPPGATGPNAGGRQNPPAEAAPTAISLPSGTQVEAAYQGTKLEFKPEEQVAFLFAQSIRRLEYDECSHQLNRLCTLEELISGVAGNNGQMIGLARNPNQDPSYRYTLTISGTNYQIAAIPRHPGLGGFLYLGSKGFGGGHFYYNPAGPASTRDESLSEFGHSGEDFRRR